MNRLSEHHPLTRGRPEAADEEGRERTKKIQGKNWRKSTLTTVMTYPPKKKKPSVTGTMPEAKISLRQMLSGEEKPQHDTPVVAGLRLHSRCNLTPALLQVKRGTIAERRES